MYSQLDSLFKIQKLRHVETLDTRQGIKRQDPLKNKKKHTEKDKNDKDPDIWEDHITVSLQALKSFLEQLAGETQKTEASVTKSGENISISEPPLKTEDDKSDKSASSRNVARGAAQAYQKTYEVSHTDEQKNAPSIGAPSIKLSPEEIRIIHKLIEDLSLLAAQNVEYLTLRKNESFLQSLVETIESSFP